jgi:hypothetical protein
MADAPMTVVETARFLKDVKPMMSDSEHEELVAFVEPEAVRSFRDRGVRKIRDWLPRQTARRVIYYYHTSACRYSCWPPTVLREGKPQHAERTPKA